MYKTVKEQLEKTGTINWFYKPKEITDSAMIAHIKESVKKKYSVEPISIEPVECDVYEFNELLVRIYDI